MLKNKRETKKWKGSHETNHRTGSHFLIFSEFHTYSVWSTVPWYVLVGLDLSLFNTHFLYLFIQTYSPPVSMSSKCYSKGYYQSVVQIKMSILLEGNTEIEETMYNWVVAARIHSKNISHIDENYYIIILSLEYTYPSRYMNYVLIFYFGECGMLELNKYIFPDKRKIIFLKYLPFKEFLFSYLYFIGWEPGL